MSSLQYSALFPKKGLCSGFDKDKKKWKTEKDQHHCSGRVLPQNTSWYQDMIYQIRRDTRNTTRATAQKGGFITASQMETREQSSSSMSGMSPHSSGTVGRCSERAGLIISCQKQGRTDQTLLIWLTWWCGLYSSLQDRSWWRSAIESVLISRSSFSTSVLAFAMTSSVRCNTGNIRIWCDCEDIP